MCGGMRQVTSNAPPEAEGAEADPPAKRQRMGGGLEAPVTDAPGALPKGARNSYLLFRSCVLAYHWAVSYCLNCHTNPWRRTEVPVKKMRAMEEYTDYTRQQCLGRSHSVSLLRSLCAQASFGERCGCGSARRGTRQEGTGREADDGHYTAP